jgi:hypothetical protein
MAEETGRIMIDEVRAAYAETGLEPITEAWYEPPSPGGGPGRACGLGAVLIRRSGTDAARYLEDEAGDADLRAAKWLGLDRDYVDGFLSGFDDFYAEEDRGDAYHQGWLDGRAAAEAVLTE